MKRKLSLLMVLMMVLTLIPAMPSFAATANRVDRVVSVTSDGDLTTGNTPKLLIDADDKSDIATGQVFRVELGDGAEWDTTAYPSTPDTALTVQNAGSATAKRISDKRLEITLGNVDGTSIVEIPMSVKFDGAPEGAQKVKVVALNSGVTAGEYTYATVGAGEVTMKVDSKVKISRSGNKTVDFIIDEVAVGSFDNGEDYSLKLPKDFSWGTVTVTGAATGAVSATDNRVLNVDVTSADDAKLQSIYVTAQITPSRDAKFGDVTMTVTKGEISPSSLVIAEYVDYIGTITVDKVLDVVSGKDEDKLYTAKIKIEEPVAATLLQNRFIEFSFNKDNASFEDEEMLKLTRKAGNGVLELDASSSKALVGTALAATAEVETTVDGKLVDSHQFDVKVTTGSTTATKYELEIPFVVSALYEGDVVLTVEGAGVEKQDVVIAKAKKPVTIEIDKNSSADLKIGLQKQTAPDIIITETEAGALSEDTIYTIANRYTENNIIWKDAKIEVIEGDLELDADDSDISANDKGVDIAVETKSTKASKIKISGVEVTLDRTVPYGPFEVNFNFGITGKEYNNLSSRVERKAYFNVVTPAPGDQNATTTFTMDSTTYTMIINGQPQQMTMDVAPFIQDNRAMLPIKYVADAIGAKVNYDSMSRVATFTKDATVAALYLDSNILYVNGTPVTMDTKPVISNGRAMVPVIYVAQAFGFQYGTDLVYDAATRAVTIFPVAK
ncbi:copper amine oxidase N-terminal domain-containing protein [Acetoanaerobium noterae]|uniref:copper amine oxidase N-terminal domain-containing protein n=1 Tax=Acetoanaerobium noterae TaxID=745369 RepID=UPI00333E9404